MTVYVQAVDGLLYADPMPCGEGWFACFDEDEAPEIVVRRPPRATPAQQRVRAELALAQGGIPARVTVYKNNMSRYMPPAFRAEKASSFHFELRGPIPKPQTGQGVQPFCTDHPCYLFWHEFEARVIAEALTGGPVDALLAQAILKRGHYEYKDVRRELRKAVRRLFPGVSGTLEELLRILPARVRVRWHGYEDFPNQRRTE